MTSTVPISTSPVVFVGGHTGGHLHPGLALAKAIRELTGIPTLFLSSGHRLETGILAREPDVAFREVRELADRGPLGLWRCRRCVAELFESVEPRAVVALGGGSAFVPGLLARWRHLPLFLLEQNRVIGRTQRWLARFCTRLFLSFHDTNGVGGRLRRCALRLGCPVDAAFRDDRPGTSPTGAPMILVMGGSQGAQQINQLIVRALSVWPSRASIAAIKRWRFVHLCGAGKEGDLRSQYARAGIDAEVLDYAHHVPDLLRAASFVVARSGGSTVAEIAAVGRAALFLPYPHHRDRQQFLNARALTEIGAAIELDGDASRFIECCEELLEQPQRLEHMGQLAHTLSDGRAADRIAAVIATHLEALPPTYGVSSDGVANCALRSRARKEEAADGE